MIALIVTLEILALVAKIMIVKIINALQTVVVRKGEKMYEIYELRLIHYMEDNEGGRTLLEEPIVFKSIYKRMFGNSSVLINDMLDKMRDYVLRKVGK